MCGREDNNEMDPKESGCTETHRINLRIRYSCEYCEDGNKPSRSRNHYCLANEKRITHSECTENQKNHILCSTHIYIYIFFLENRVVYEIMWKYTVEQGRPHSTTWRMRIACWMLKATDTH